MTWVWVIGIVAALLTGFIVFAVPLAARWQRRDARQAIFLFRQRRKHLETRFFEMARSAGKPRGLRWLGCDWFDDVTFARDKNSGLLTAFVAINIRFEAIQGGEMEGVAAVDTVRDAVAVFHFHQGSWGTGGKALFNMNPQDALLKLVAQFEPVSVV